MFIGRIKLFSVVFICAAFSLDVDIDLISLDADKWQHLVQDIFNLLRQLHLGQVLLVVLPVGGCHSPNQLKELHEGQPCVLRSILLLTFYGHLAEAVTHFEDVLIHQGSLYSEDVVGFAVLQPCLVDRLVSVVKFLKAEDVGCKHIVHIKGPQVARSELLPRGIDLVIGQKDLTH